jgi:hypothetical protein
MINRMIKQVTQARRAEVEYARQIRILVLCPEEGGRRDGFRRVTA